MFYDLHINYFLLVIIINNYIYFLQKDILSKDWPSPEVQNVSVICPLIDRHREMKQYLSSEKATNMTAIKAAKVILDHVLNDSCDWVSQI